MCEAVEGFGGAVRALMGDGIAAFFGIETAREDDTERAARAALEIRKVIAQYSSEVREAWGITNFQVRVGVNRGRVAVGLVGGNDPLTTALGDPVNVAARLQSAARPGTVLVGGSVAALLEGRFALRRMGPIAIRGRTVPVEAFELSAEQTEPHIRYGSPFVGRSRELRAISSMVDELQEGRGQICFVLGEGGLGKSRLMSEARARTSSDVLWLEGFCDPMDHRLPFEPFVQALRGWLGIAQRASPIETRVRLVTRGGALFGDRFEDVAGYLARLLGVELTGKLHRRLDGLPQAALSAGLWRSYSDWLVAIARTQPVVLAIDNFGCASTASAELAKALLESVEAAPIALLFTMRPDVRSPGWEARSTALASLRSRCVEIELSSLAPADCQELLDGMDSSCVLADSLRELIVQRAEGNPLYVEELYAALVQAPEMPHLDDISGALPGALEALLLSRIDALPIESRSLLQSAAVLGRRFARDVLVEMNPTCDFNRALSALLRADVIREFGREPAGYTFRHGLIREAVLSTLTPSRYRRLNAHAAQALESWGAFDLERDAEVLAGYYLAAGDMNSAISSLEQLGNRLAMVYRLPDAKALFQRCLDELEDEGPIADRLRISMKQAEVQWSLGDVRDSIRLVDVAIGLEKGHGQAALMLAKAERLVALGKVSEAKRILSSCLSNEIDGKERVRALVLRGGLGLAHGDLALVDDSIREIGEFTALDPDSAFQVASLIAGTHATKGSLDEAEFWALRAQTLSDQVGRVCDQLSARRHVAIVCMLKGCVREAFELQKQVYDTSARLHLGAQRIEAGVNLISVAELVGELDYGLKVGSDLMNTMPASSLNGVMCNLACIRIELGDPETAEELANGVLTAVGETRTWERSVASRVLATGEALRGEHLKAKSRLLQLRQESEGHERASERMLVDCSLANLAWLERDADGARQRAKDVLASVGTLDKVVALSAERQMLEILGSFGEPVLERLSALGGAAGQMGLRLEEGRVYVSLGALDAERSEDHFERARQIFEETGCKRGLDEIQDARHRLLQSACASQAR